MVELARELIVDGRPGGATVEGDTSAAIIALDHALWIVRVDPQIVVIAMGCGDFRIVLAAVSGFPHAKIVDINCVGMLWIGEDVAVVPGALDQILDCQKLAPM